MPYIHEGSTFSTIMNALTTFNDIRNQNKSKLDRGLDGESSLQRSSI